jgi:hypothetical protein
MRFMGLTVYYDWQLPCDVAKARRLIVKLREIALDLPFDMVSEVYEQDPPDQLSPFEVLEFEGDDERFRVGSIYMPRKRDDGLEELVRVDATHAVFFNANIEGAETVSVGLAAHPPVVVHREDLIRRRRGGGETRRMNAGAAIEFPTRRRGKYSWHSFCKTQYANHPKLGGEANFLRAHLTLIELLDRLKPLGIKVRVRDDSRYANHRNVDKLLAEIRKWDAIVAGFVGQIGDALRNARADAGEPPPDLVAPIADRADFEHLEAKGIEVIRDLARRQQRRKRR